LDGWGWDPDSVNMFTSQDVSVIIPSYNSFKTIRACLDSLRAQDAHPLEIIVVDSSSDDTPELIKQCYPGVNLHRLNHRTFPGPARNLGASIAKGAIVAFIDADCIAEPGWVARLAERHSEGHLIVGGAIDVGNPLSSIAWAGHLGEFREFLPFGEQRPVLHIPTCNLSYRRYIFGKYGGFPNAYYPQEDLLFNYMLSRYGLQVWFDPGLRIRHYCREDLRGYLSHQHRIGRVTRCTLRRIEMEGSPIARRAWLAWLASPALAVLKFFRTMGIFSRHFSSQYHQTELIPLLILGSIWWGRGFASGARTGLSGVRGWNDPDEPIFARILSKSKEGNVGPISKEASP
jgi:glycosyltransferase involved in cell wall biosynthesis